jgi:hypothetical protein
LKRWLIAPVTIGVSGVGTHLASSIIGLGQDPVPCSEAFCRSLRYELDTASIAFSAGMRMSSSILLLLFRGSASLKVITCSRIRRYGLKPCITATPV